MAIKQVIAGGFPFTSFVAENATNQVILGGQTFVVESSSTNASPSVVGVTASTAAGTLATSRSITLTGVSSSSAIGSLTDAVSVTLTGVAATSAVGTPSVKQDGAITLTGVETDSAIGTLTVEQEDRKSVV